MYQVRPERESTPKCDCVSGSNGPVAEWQSRGDTSNGLGKAKVGCRTLENLNICFFRPSTASREIAYRSAISAAHRIVGCPIISLVPALGGGFDLARSVCMSASVVEAALPEV